MQDAPYTAVRHARKCLSVFTCRSPWTAAGGCQHSGSVLRCKLRMADQLSMLHVD